MTTTSSAATRSYAIDPIHSSIEFSVRHLMISKVRGAFTSFGGTVTLPSDGTLPTALTAHIDAASIETRDAQRDGHLKSPDFLDVAAHPSITFTSTRIEAADATSFKAIGTLELHGVSKTVTLDAEVTGEGKDQFGNHRVAFEATTKINRKDFGLSWNLALETGGVAVGDEISIILNIESLTAA